MLSFQSIILSDGSVSAFFICFSKVSLPIHRRGHCRTAMAAKRPATAHEGRSPDPKGSPPPPPPPHLHRPVQPFAHREVKGLDVGPREVLQGRPLLLSRPPVARRRQGLEAGAAGQAPPLAHVLHAAALQHAETTRGRPARATRT